jgi:tetratricopeptide (TPR) repeat protein
MNRTTVLLLVPLVGACIWLGFTLVKDHSAQQDTAGQPSPLLATNRPSSEVIQPHHPQRYKPRINFDSSGSASLYRGLKPWTDPTSLEAIREATLNLGHRNIAQADAFLAGRLLPDAEVFQDRFQARIFKASMFMYEGEPTQAYQVLQEARAQLAASPRLANEWLYSVIFFQGVAGLRQGENDNCVQCRGKSACIFPIRATAVHTNPAGSRLAIKHFTEYLEQFPNDLGARWLLNLAYMTLGEYPQGIPPQYRMPFEKFGSEDDIGCFHDISHLVGINRFSEAGGAIMDDFDNDGLLDLVVTSSDPAQAMAFFRNKGDGTFEERTEAAGLSKQYGGLNCVQTDYNNDGFLDIFIPRGAWFKYPMRPTLLRNNGNGTFTDVTREAGLMDPVNSNCATWADFDNDGFLDVYICNETGPNRLYRNRGDGTFEEVAAKAGVRGKGKWCKGANWIDYDNDGYPDLFLNYDDSTPQLFHNNRDGTFTDATAAMGITGPKGGFSCWAFDYDNDGWLDIFATCYQRDLDHIVGDMLGIPVHPAMEGTRLYRNLGGKQFQDVSRAAGVDKVFSTMGSNFADFDNDGYLDFYLATGEPSFATLVPNRMFRNIAGQRFADISTTSGTGHLQKGHGVACGDWDRDGNVDLFVELGGAIPGDRYHCVLFQNPGHGNHWLTVKLIGQKTNRAAIGARIKAVTAGEKPLTVHRHVSSGSSFGANPLQQTLGLGKAAAVATLEIRWPTSQTTQVFHNVAADQAIEITEFAKDYRKLNWTRLAVPHD